MNGNVASTSSLPSSPSSSRPRASSSVSASTRAAGRDAKEREDQVRGRGVSGEEENGQDKDNAPVSIAQLRSKFENLATNGTAAGASSSRAAFTNTNSGANTNAATSSSSKTASVPQLTARRLPVPPIAPSLDSGGPSGPSVSRSGSNLRGNAAAAQTVPGAVPLSATSSFPSSIVSTAGATASEPATTSSTIPPTSVAISPPTPDVPTHRSITLDLDDTGNVRNDGGGGTPGSSSSKGTSKTRPVPPQPPAQGTTYGASRTPSSPLLAPQNANGNASINRPASESLAGPSRSLPPSLSPSPNVPSSSALRVPPPVPPARANEPSSTALASSPSAPANMHFPSILSSPRRRAPPAVPGKSPSLTASPAEFEDGNGDVVEKPTSVKALRDMFAVHKVSSSDSGPPSRRSSYAEIKVTTAVDLTETSPDQPFNVKSKPPPPPPPISRSSSPSLQAQSDRTPKATLTASPIATPPMLSRNPSSSSLAAVLPPPAIPPAPSAATPPQLPARRPTLPSIEPPPFQQPPPLPANKPIAATMAYTHSNDAALPPPNRVAERRRASTFVNKPENNPPPPPRVPFRTATLAPPARVVQPNLDGYQPPPPPVRNAGAATASASSSPRKNADGGGDASSEEDEDAPIAGLTPLAQRQLEDYPVSTQANRRPPSYVPDIRLACTNSITAFAVYGRHACIAHHHVRVYDTQMSDQPLFSIDLKDVGLDFRVKEPRVTAMCFRPALHKEDEGRYVWCGTKDGHVWELDIRTGAVTLTKPFVHSAAVLYIFRHKQNVITVDESGKVLCFEADSDDLEPRLVRSSRVSDKLTMAKMLNGRLWTATAPPTRSTTNAASSRGPTIRVYDPCGTGATLQTAFTSEWAGAATSATILPLDPSRVFIGHEGGFISIWSAEEMTCTQVLKISGSDIVSLEGVGERLWAGNRKGQIHVYDISEKPWTTTNIWTAHADQPVYSLVIDPWSIENAGRFTLWSGSREHIRAWDGLLAVDWIDGQMVQRQPDYCAFREIRVLVCSWNIDSAKPTDLSGSVENATFLEQCIGSVDSPDIIVFGFQEVIPLTDKKLTAKTLLFGNKNKDGLAAADRVSAAYRQWQDKLQQAVRLASSPDCPYVKVHSESLVGLFTCMFIKSSEKDTLRDVSITTVKRGIGGIYGNKGAIVARMVLDDTSICFINVHLAAGQSQKSSRNADLAAIMEDKAIFPPADQMPYVNGGDGTGILDHEMVILNGDLNYRIDQRRDNVVSNINAGDLNFLLEHDQLRKEMRGNHSFRLRSFDEAPITFAPTYKYDPGSDEYDSSEKRRIPAWCDRILYTKSPRVQSLSYRRYETTASDHRPVSAGLALTVKAVDGGRMVAVRREVVAEWAKREIDVLAAMSEAYSHLL